MSSLMEMFNKKMTRDNIKRCAKAVYLVSNEGIRDMVMYLEAVVEWGYLTEEETDKIMSELSSECVNIYCYKIEELRKHINEMK